MLPFHLYTVKTSHLTSQLQHDTNKFNFIKKPATLNIQIYHHKEYSNITHKKIHSWYDTSNLSSNERSVTQQQVRSSLNRFLMSTSSLWVDKYFLKIIFILVFFCDRKSSKITTRNYNIYTYETDMSGNCTLGIRKRKIL